MAKTTFPKIGVTQPSDAAAVASLNRAPQPSPRPPRPLDELVHRGPADSLRRADAAVTGAFERVGLPAPGPLYFPPGSPTPITDPRHVERRETAVDQHRRQNQPPGAVRGKEPLGALRSGKS